MKKNILTILILLSSLVSSSQIKMRSINELTGTTPAAWDFLKQIIDKAKNKVEVLAVDAIKANEALYNTQVTVSSSMGAIVYNTGGILIDNGWIRILGSGHTKLNRSLPNWNKGKAFQEFGQSSPYFLIADDAIGGFFILNGGGLGKDVGKVYYFSPDTLQFEPLGITYSEFLDFCFNNDLNEFYKDLRWNNWQQEVSKLAGDKVFSFYPYLWSREGKDINKNSRKIIDIEEQYKFNIEAKKQLNQNK